MKETPHAYRDQTSPAGDIRYSGDTVVNRRHRALAVTSAAMALAGFAGAVGLVGGAIDFGDLDDTIHNRIPWHSMTLAGAALLAAVALPMGVAAVGWWRGSRHADTVGIIAGTALVVWIAVEAVVVRTYSWMQPTCAAYGLMVAGLAWRARHHDPGGVARQ